MTFETILRELRWLLANEQLSPEGLQRVQALVDVVGRANEIVKKNGY